MNFEALSTEQVNEQSTSLDALSPLEAVRLMNAIDQQAIQAVASAMPQIAEVIAKTARRMKMGGRLLYAGAGTSGRLGVLDASECPPTFGTDPELVVGVIAGGDRALRFAVEGAEDHPELGRQDMEEHKVCEKDVVVAISASGYAPYCVGCLEYARERGAYAVALSCNPGSIIGSRADTAIEVPTGPEILSGSTRLKAGTATKLVLNMITTLTMVQLGKVYKNLMVDMKPSNYKLNDRAVRIVKSALELESREEAEGLLSAANGSTKAAIVSYLAGCSPSEAQSVLNENGGYVRKAIETLRPTKEGPPFVV